MAIIGGVDANAKFYSFDPWSRADVIMIRLVDEVEFSFGKSDVRIGVTIA